MERVFLLNKNSKEWNVLGLRYRVLTAGEAVKTIIDSLSYAYSL